MYKGEIPLGTNRLNSLAQGSTLKSSLLNPKQIKKEPEPQVKVLDTTRTAQEKVVNQILPLLGYITTKA